MDSSRETDLGSAGNFVEQVKLYLNLAVHEDSTLIQAEPTFWAKMSNRPWKKSDSNSNTQPFLCTQKVSTL